jgi:monoamine oxidase
MAGLMTSFLLQSVGIKNWKIIESSRRVGGYAEMDRNVSMLTSVDEFVRNT